MPIAKKLSFEILSQGVSVQGKEEKVLTFCGEPAANVRMEG